jgi:formate hydrogenlyase subunit 4
MVAQAFHIALMLALAPLVIGLQRWSEAALTGRTGPLPWQPWRDLIRLSRKQPTVAENASPLFRIAPLACLAAMAVAASVVPSFTLGMAFAPLGDLLVLAGLLALGQGGLALAALDPGTAPGGLSAAGTASIACLAEPALFLAILALGLLGGTTNLDLLIGQLHQGMVQPPAAAVLAVAALVALAMATPALSGAAIEFSGADLAMVELAEALRRLVWLDLIGALCLPLGMAEQGAGPLSWIVGLAAWGAKLLVLVAGLAALRCATGRLPGSRAPQVVGVAAVLGLLAALLALASAVAA